MWDDDRDKELMRNQVIAIILMTVLVVVWFTFFVPKRPPAPPPSRPVATEQAESPQGVPTESAAEDLSQVAAAGAQDAWPFLPAIEQPDPAADEVAIENGHLRLLFTRVGGRLKEAVPMLGENGQNAVQLVPEAPDTPDTQSAYPMGLRFSDEAIQDALDVRRFNYQRSDDGRSVTFELATPALQVRKTFSLGDKPNVLDVAIECRNVGETPHLFGMDQTLAYDLSWEPNVDSRDKTKGVRQAIAWRSQGQTSAVHTTKIAGKYDGAGRVRDPEWLAARSAYFVIAMKPETEEPVQGFFQGDDNRFRFGLAVPRFELAPSEAHVDRFKVYIGPNQMSSLGAAWESLPSVLRFFESVDFMDRFSKLLLRVLNWFYAHTIPNYGVAIILLTLVVRLILYPLTLKSMRSMKKMQLLAPEMEELKKKYGDDQQEMNKRLMEMYRERGVNPLGGCFPILLQMPVLIALWRMIWSAFELRGASFLWIADLSEPDRLFHMPFMTHLPIFGQALEYFNILPILGGVAMIVQQKVMPTSGPAQNSQQKTMMTLMPILMTVLFYKWAAGLNLYILTGTVLGMAQNYFVRPGELAPVKKKKVGTKQHFYTAAKARERQKAREARKKKKPPS